MNFLFKQLAATLLIVSVHPLAVGAEYTLSSETAVVGRPTVVLSKIEDTLYSLAQRYKFGASALIDANPDTDAWMPGAGQSLMLPSQYILPDVPRKGIVVNLPEMRLYYFPAHKNSVHIYPIGIGRQGWQTPLMDSFVSSIDEDPVWTPPVSIRQEYAKAGLVLPPRVEAGPHNPLGEFSLRIGDTSYLIHGTNKPEGVGLRVSHGCIRLYPSHIRELASLITIGMPVRVVNQPIKYARIEGDLYIQAHQPLGDTDNGPMDGMKGFISNVEKKLTSVELHALRQYLRKASNEGSLYTGNLKYIYTPAQ